MKALFFFLSAMSILRANPTVVHGEAVISKVDQLTEITTSHKAILHWEEFSVGKGETTQFVQPSIDSAVLNRVLGSEVSQIMGNLKANGRVYLVNPNGVVIGEEGRIDTAAFIASALDIQNGEFLNGENLNFEGSSLGEVINLGHIETTTGSIALIGHRIENAGTLISPETVTLTSGHHVLLDATGDGLLYVLPELKGEGVENSGKIEALKTQIQADGSPGSLAISHSGIIEANAIEMRDGEVYLVANDGQLECSGSIVAENGTVHLLGDQVSLIDDTTIDVSGKNSAGTVLVGGDYRGSNPEIFNANQTFVGKDVEILANSLESGDAGKVIIWATDTTEYYGHVSAQALGQSGDGGFVEVSGREHLLFRGLADLRAFSGKTGLLLLDPTNITIGDTATGGVFNAGPTITYTPGPNPDTILIGDLTTQLGVANVEIDSSAGAGGAGTIEVNSASLATLTWSANNLHLTAPSNITFTTAVTTTGSASLDITTPLNFFMNGNLTLGGSGTNALSAGAFTVNGPLTLSGSSSTSFTCTAVADFSVDANFNILGSASASFSLTRDFQLQNGNTLTYSSTASPFVIDAPVEHFYFGNVVINSDADVQLIGPFVDVRDGIVNNGNGDLTLGSTGDVTVQLSPIVCNGTGDLNLNGTGTLLIILADVTVNQNINVAGTFNTIIFNTTNIQANTITNNLSPAANLVLAETTITTQNSSLNFNPVGPWIGGGTVGINMPGSLVINAGIKPLIDGFPLVLNTTASSVSLPSGIDSNGANFGLTLNATNADVYWGGSSSITDPIEVNANGITFFNGVSIDSTSTITMVANQDITAVGSGIIQTLNSDDLNLVTDNSFPNPPDFGTGKFTFPSDFTLCTNSCGGGASKVLLFSAVQGESTFPSMINNEAVAEGVNEFIGFWYLTQPPPDPPLYQLVYKIAGNVMAPAIIEEIQIAITEPVSNPPQITQILEGTLSPPSTPDPKTPCRTPPVAVQAL